MNEVLTLDTMAANVELSRGHIVKQDAIIVRLTEQGHEVMAGEARVIFASMHEHLVVELEMLARMEREAAGSGQAI